MANYSFEVDYSEDSDYNLSDFYYDTASPCGMEKNQQMQHIIQLYAHSIICILGLVGNILVIVTYTLYKRTKSMTDVYLLNVAVADLMFVVVLPLIIYNEQHNWDMGNWACKLLRGMYSINLYSGTLLLACISGDRYISIVQARRSFRIRSRTLTYSRFICVAVWALAFALSVPTFIFFQRYNPKPSEVVCHFWIDNSSALMVKVMVPSTQIAVGFLLPFLIMGFCYTSIIVTLLQAKNFQRHKAVRVVMAVVVVFVACHLPYNITLLYHTVVKFKTMDCKEYESISMALTVTETLAYLHCCLNPVLYAFIGVKFRNHFLKILEDLWCLGKRYMYSRRSSRVTSEFYVPRKSTEGNNNENASSFTM
ncbi:C-C chemokine receptor type 6-like [Arapaima gigas]